MTEPIIPKISIEQFEKLSPKKQALYLKLYREQVAPKLEVFREPAPYKLTYGGRGSSKSWGAASLLMQKLTESTNRLVCCREIQNSIDESAYRLLVDTIQRLDLQGWDIKKETLDNANGSHVIFRGLRDLRAARSIKSLEGYNLCWLEEAQSISKESLELLLPTIRANNAEIWACWNPNSPDDPIEKLKTRKGAVCVEMNWNDNPWFTERSRAEMEADYAEDPDNAEHVWGGKYRKQGDNCIMNRVSIREAMERKADTEGAISIGVDCARYGNDRTTMFKRKGLQLLEYKVYKKTSITEEADYFELFCGRDRNVHACIDGGGVGGGLIDVLRERGYRNITEVNFGEKAVDSDKYDSAASEMWFTFPLSDCGLLDIPELMTELSDRRYSFNRKGQKVVEAKDDYKKRHGGKSPDLADGLLLCFYERHEVMPMLY
jgi:phage terminase large subunit